jgi:nitrilase
VVSCCMLLRKSSFPADFEFAEELKAAGDFTLAGGSCIVAPDGRLLAGPLWKEEGILYADLDLSETVQAGQLFDAVGHYARPEVLGLRLNTGAHQVFTLPEGAQ